MQNTTSAPTIPAIESLSPDVLFQVSGGCHHGGCQQVQQVQQVSPVQIIQMPQMPSPVPQAPVPAAAPTGGGDQVSTSVSINGQPAQ